MNYFMSSAFFKRKNNFCGIVLSQLIRKLLKLLDQSLEVPVWTVFGQKEQALIVLKGCFKFDDIWMSSNKKQVVSFSHDTFHFIKFGHMDLVQNFQSVMFLVKSAFDKVNLPVCSLSQFRYRFEIFNSDVLNSFFFVDFLFIFFHLLRRCLLPHIFVF